MEKFEFILAPRLGLTLDGLAELSAEEFLRWQTRNAASPIGELRDDWRHARLCHTIAAYSMGGTRQGLNAFLMWRDGPVEPEQKQSPEEMTAAWGNYCGVINQSRANGGRLRQ